jgi:hypothetical protein
MSRSWSDRFQAKQRIGACLIRLGHEYGKNWLSRRGTRIRACRVKAAGKYGWQPEHPERVEGVPATECSQHHRALRGGYRCNDIGCEPCQHDRAVRRATSTATIIDTAISRCDRPMTVLRVELTVRHTVWMALYFLLALVQSSWHKLINRKFWKDRIIGGIRNLEVKWSRHGWHPHLHLLLLVEGLRPVDRKYSRSYLKRLGFSELLDLTRQEYGGRIIPRRIRNLDPSMATVEQVAGAEEELRKALNQREEPLSHQLLSWEWEVVTGGSSVVYLTDITAAWKKDGGFDAAQEVCKYPVKGLSLSGITDSRIVELYEAMDGCRIYSTFGIVKEIAKELGEPEEELINDDSQSTDELEDVYHCPDCGEEVELVYLVNPQEWIQGADPIYAIRDERLDAVRSVGWERIEIVQRE